jgi:hemerythrin-like domain-containing protein
MSESEILDAMMKDHERVSYLLSKVKKAGSNELIDSFDAFEWFLKKHMFVEEKAVFESFNNVVTDGYDVIPRLVDEHNHLLDLLRDLRKKILNGEKADFGRFEIVLGSHKEFEELSIYPRLDQELSPDDKGALLDRIRDVM